MESSLEKCPACRFGKLRAIPAWDGLACSACDFKLPATVLLFNRTTESRETAIAAAVKRWREESVK